MYVEHPITGMIEYRCFRFDFVKKQFPTWFLPYPQEATCIKPHKQTDMELLYIADGVFSIIINSVNTEVHKGDLLIINPNDTHTGFVSTLQNYAAYHMIKIGLAQFSDLQVPILSEIADKLMKEKIKLSNFLPCEILEKSGMGHHVREMIRNNQMKSEADSLRFLGSLCYFLSIAFAEKFTCKAPVIISNIRKKNEFVTRMLVYFEENWNLPVTSQDAAKEFSYSQEYFCKIFKENMGKTFSQFLIELKIHKAKELLDSGMKSGDVMEQIGLNNYSYFYRSFKHFYGVSPEYFKRKKKKPK